MAPGKVDPSEKSGIGKDDMGKLKEKLEAAIRQAPDVGKLKDQVQHERDWRRFAHRADRKQHQLIL